MNYNVEMFFGTQESLNKKLQNEKRKLISVQKCELSWWCLTFGVQNESELPNQYERNKLAQKIRKPLKV